MHRIARQRAHIGREACQPERNQAGRNAVANVVGKRTPFGQVEDQAGHFGGLRETKR